MIGTLVSLGDLKKDGFELTTYEDEEDPLKWAFSCINRIFGDDWDAEFVEKNDAKWHIQVTLEKDE